jgi:hypothetical protein
MWESVSWLLDCLMLGTPKRHILAGTTMSLLENSLNYFARARDLDIPSGVWILWSLLWDSKDLGRSLLLYCHFGAFSRTGPISCLDTLAVADLPGATSNRGLDPMVCPGHGCATHTPEDW